MKKIILALSVFLFAYGFCFSQDDKDAFMVYGSDFMINYPLPTEWQVDMDFAHQNGINAFFYLERYRIQDSPVGIIMILAERPDEKTSISDYIKYDQDFLIDYYKGFQLKEIKEKLKQKHGYDVYLYEFHNKDNTGHYQNIAYIECHGKYFIKLYIDCKTRNGNEKYVEDFISGVFETSYLNIKVEIKN